MSGRPPSAKGEPPTILARRFVTYLVGFGVAVATSAGVFLGMSRVPAFAPLLEVLPEEPKELRDLVVPISGFVVGLVALAVQFYAGERVVRSRLRRRFTAGLRLLLIGLVALLGLTLYCVKNIEFSISPGKPRMHMVFIAGLWKRPECLCEGFVTDQGLYDCMKGLAFDPSGCWSDASVFLAKLSLALSYLAVIGGFGALVGLLLLQETARRQEAARKHKRSKARRPTRKRRRAAEDAPPGPPERDERSVSRTNGRSSE